MLRFNSKHGFLFYPNKDFTEPKTYKIIDTDNNLTEMPFVIPKNETSLYKDFCKAMINEEEKFKRAMKGFA